MRFNLAALFLLFNAGSAFGIKVVSDCELPFNVKGKVDLACDNTGGNTITFGGILATDDVDATLIFSNNKKMTHMHDESVEATLTLSTDGEIEFAKQPPLGGVGGNPHIFFAPDCGYSRAIYLGRCVQGGDDIDYDGLLDTDASYEVTSDGSCSNNPGPYITLEGELTVAKTVGGCFIFKNSVKNPQHIRNEDGDLTVWVTILEEGETIKFSKQPPLGGAGGNPHIFLEFGCSDETFYLGRCKKL